jgi:hypothetical protein
MSKAATARVAEPLPGDKLYQRRARLVLPILVRQAEAATPIFYSSLAREAGIPRARNLNFVLGCIGQTMAQLSKEWKETIPPIQCLVINKHTELPGEGIGWFLVKEKEYKKLPLRQKREIVQAELRHIFAYRHWRKVLRKLSLNPLETDHTELVQIAARSRNGGESPEHKALKEYIARHPELVGLPPSTPHGITEDSLPSGDSLDVSFRTRKLWLAVEVKSALSDNADITRGIFQCVKYRAVLDAVLLAKSQPQNSRAVLVLESPLPPSLIPLCNTLAVEVRDAIRPHAGESSLYRTELRSAGRQARAEP